MRMHVSEQCLNTYCLLVEAGRSVLCKQFTVDVPARVPLLFKEPLMWTVQLTLCAACCTAPTQTQCLPSSDTFQSVKCHLQSCSLKGACVQYRWATYCAIHSNNYATVTYLLPLLPLLPIFLPTFPLCLCPSPSTLPSLPSSPSTFFVCLCVALKTCTLKLFESKHVSVAAMQAYASSAHAVEGVLGVPLITTAL